MSERLLPVPPSCREALEAIQADPLELAPDVRRHLRTCPACAEARVLWLAAEEAPLPLVAAGYFDRLPARVLGKLPAKAPRGRHALLWSVAATLLLGVGTTAFWAGRANGTPVTEAANHVPAEVQTESLDAPFHNGDDVMDQLSTLTPEEARTLMDHLDTKDERR
jgi:hypothetical protein